MSPKNAPAENILPANLKELFLNGTPLIDVRAPIEFEQGCLPNAINLPILNDDERAQIGTVYKNQGNAAAVQLGHQLISGEVKEARLKQWVSFLQQNPSAILYCFRGGMRSQITQQWLKEAGIDRPLIVGGYKASRQFLMDKIESFSSSAKLLSIIGPTGSGKTQFLEELQSSGSYPTIQLEGIARHRGSAFGALTTPQPTQINFENQLAVSLLALENDQANTEYPLVEDESRLIGRCILPAHFFALMQSSEAIWIDESLENRIEHIFQEYILNSPIGLLTDGLLTDDSALPQFAKYKKSLHSISKKLGGLRTQEILSLLEIAETAFIESKDLKPNREWIEKLLVYYYDPLYLKSIERRNITVIFKGSKAECLAYLSR